MISPFYFCPGMEALVLEPGWSRNCMDFFIYKAFTRIDLRTQNAALDDGTFNMKAD
jgi:hypothetical protein